MRTCQFGENQSLNTLSYLLIGGLRFSKNHGRGDSIFFVKMVGSPYSGEKGHVSNGMMYGICSSNALYSASL